MKKITNEELINKHQKKFLQLRKSGLTLIECANILGISPKSCGRLAKLSGITHRLLKWQKVCMPETFSERTISLLYGTLLGDSSIHIPGFKAHKSFSMAHSPKQKAYLKYKRDLLKEIKPYEIKDSGDKWGTLVVRTAPHPEFDKIYNDFYSKNGKQITEKILDKLTPEAIALWFMDDGCTRIGQGFSIATCSFNKESIYLLQKYFLINYNIYFRITSLNKYPRLSVWSKDALKFKALIEQYVIPEMKYKLYLKPKIGTGKQRKRKL